MTSEFSVGSAASFRLDFFRQSRSICRTIYTNQEFLSEFEQYCLQGDLTSLQTLLTSHEYLKKEFIFLNGLLLSIQYRHAKIFEYLIQLPIYKNIIEKNLAVIKNQLTISNQMKFLSKFEQIYPSEHLKTIPEPTTQLAYALTIERLSTYYHSQLRSHDLNHQIWTIKQYLANLYHTQSVSLPLEYEKFQILKEDLTEYQIQTAQKTYQSSLLHTAWRLLHHEHDWFHDQQEKLTAQYLHQHAWLLILIWLAARDDQQISADIMLQDRIQIFFERLALLPKYSQDSQAQCLVHTITAHPICRILSLETLHAEYNNFIKQPIQQKIAQLSQLELNEMLQQLTSNPLIHEHTLMKILPNHEDYQNFTQYMQQQWQQQWLDNLEIQKFSKLNLSSTPYIIHSFQSTFIEMIKTHLKLQNLKQTQLFFHHEEIPSHHVKTAQWYPE